MSIIPSFKSIKQKNKQRWDVKYSRDKSWNVITMRTKSITPNLFPHPHHHNWTATRWQEFQHHCRIPTKDTSWIISREDIYHLSKQINELPVIIKLLIKTHLFFYFRNVDIWVRPKCPHQQDKVTVVQYSTTFMGDCHRHS